jgi:hypothetical protein
MIHRDRPTDSALVCAVKGNQLVVSIGISTLARSIIGTPEFEDDRGSRVTIKDEKAFAEAMAARLDDPVDETGETSITTALIKAARELIEMGDERIDYRDASEA